LPISAFLDSTQRWALLGANTFRFSEFIQEVTPHEVSHQWWGHMVGWTTFHDQWLSEGFADFSAGLFLQLTEHKNDKYLKYWERARDAITKKNEFGRSPNEAGPLWMGLRLNTFKTQGAYNRIVYPKGGYVVHMLRYLMEDPKTGDEDFIDMMHDFVKTYLHKTATTQNFQAVVEKHMKKQLDLEGNGRMNWFFREWVYGTDIPKYRLDYSLTPQPDGKVALGGTITQSDVSNGFRMAIPLYVDIDGHAFLLGRTILVGNQTSKEFKVVLPKKPKRVLLNANYDVLASESIAKEL
jgi:aminopeptidase N